MDGSPAPGAVRAARLSHMANTRSTLVRNIAHLSLILVATLATARAERPAETVAATAGDLGSATLEDRLAAREAIQTAGAQASRPGAEAERVAFAKACLGFLSSSNPQPTRVWLARMLGLFGGEESVSALAGLLGDSDAELRDAARRALQASPSPKASDALRAALGSTKDAVAVCGLMDGLAYRRDGGAVDAIAKRLGDPDPAVASAAVLALGKIGDARAIAALAAARARASDAVKREIDNAILDAPSADAKVLGTMADGGDPAIRCGALARLMKVDPAAGSAKVTVAIRDRDAHVASAALRLAIDSNDRALRKSAIDALPSLAPHLQATAATILGEAAAAEAAPALKTLLKTQEEGVRIAAVTALGRCGTAEAIEGLLDRLTNGGKEEQAAAARALTVMRDPALDAKLLQAANRGSDPISLAAILAFAGRNPTGAATALAELAKASDAAVRDAALDGLKAVGTATELKPLLEIVATSGDAKTRSRAQGAAGAIASRSPDRTATLDAIRSAISRATSPANRAELVGMLPAAPSQAAVDEAVKAFGDSDQGVRDAAIRALAAWPEFNAGPALLKIAKESPAAAKQHVLAMRGIAKILGIDGPSGKDRIALAKDAIAAAKRPDEKKIIVAALGGMKAGEAQKLLEELSDDPDVGAEAKAALSKRRK